MGLPLVALDAGLQIGAEGVIQSASEPTAREVVDSQIAWCYREHNATSLVGAMQWNSARRRVGA
jgi:hypothetical protein